MESKIVKINPEIKFYYRNLRKDLATFTDLDDPLESYEFIQLPDTLNKTVFFSEDQNRRASIAASA